MTTKDLEKFFKKANRVINNYEDKLKTLEYDYFIMSNIVFTSDIDYYYCFSVFKDNQIIEKIAVNNTKEFNKTFKDLSTKYKTNVIFNYSDLNYTQLSYLNDIEDINLNREEISSILFKKQLDIF